MDLDRFIAELMGYTNIEWSDEVDTDDHYNPAGWYGTSPDGNHGIIPPFQERIECAFEVVERMRELGFRVRLETDDDLHPTGKPWYCLFEKPPEGGFGEAYSDMAQKAICLAAKAALEG